MTFTMSDVANCKKMKTVAREGKIRKLWRMSKALTDSDKRQYIFDPYIKEEKENLVNSK